MASEAYEQPCFRIESERIRAGRALVVFTLEAMAASVDQLPGVRFSAKPNRQGLRRRTRNSSSLWALLSHRNTGTQPLLWAPPPLRFPHVRFGGSQEGLLLSFRTGRGTYSTRRWLQGLNVSAPESEPITRLMLPGFAETAGPRLSSTSTVRLFTLRRISSKYGLLT